jgi:hypothetical protein
MIVVSRGSGARPPSVFDGPSECVTTGGGPAVVFRFAEVFVAGVARRAFGAVLDGAGGAEGGGTEGNRVVLAGPDGAEEPHAKEPHASRHSPSMAGIERQDTTTTIGVMTATA